MVAIYASTTGAVLKPKSVPGEISYTSFDAHARCPGMKLSEMRPLLEALAEPLQRIGYLWTSGDHVLGTQTGVFRTSCLDCLDRTNLFQTALAWRWTVAALRALGIVDVVAAAGSGTSLSSSSIADDRSFHGEALYNDVFLRLWENNGLALSKEYAGASSDKARYTKRESKAGGARSMLGGMVASAKTHAQRFYSNTFLDASRQAAIDLILGTRDAGARDDVVDARTEALLRARQDEYTTARKLSLFVGTWNVNGQPPGEDVAEWLAPRGMAKPDMYVVGFQEIVALTTENVLLTADKANPRAWEQHIQRVISQRADGGSGGGGGGGGGGNVKPVA